MTDTEKNSKITQALTSAIKELERAKECALPINIDDDYMYIELTYILINTIRNLKGFIRAKLE